VRRTAVARPPRAIFYGTAGIGKSTFAAAFPAPIFIQTEEGLDAIDADAFPLAQSFADVMDAIGVLANEEHSFRTVAIDSLDWCERLIWARVAADNGVKSIEDIGYGKGYKMALSYWRDLIDGLDYLRDHKGMVFTGIAHHKIKRFDDPLTDPYDRYMLDLHDGAAAMLIEWCDVLGFINFRVSTMKAEVGFNQKVTRAVGGGDRMIYTQERPGWQAKSRWKLPDQMKLDYATYDAALNAAMLAAIPAPIPPVDERVDQTTQQQA
jgi:hypothetical protein